MNTGQLSTLRQHVVTVLDGGLAFARSQEILAGVAEDNRGRRLYGLDYSLWELLEHLRLSQRHMLDVGVADVHVKRAWPADYWPATSQPPSADAWVASVSMFFSDLDEAKRIAANDATDLFAVVPHGSRTWLLHLLDIAEHNAHHLGQIIVVRKLLGDWKRA